MKIGEVLDQIGEDVLSSEAKTMLTEAFSEAVDNQINERLEVEIQTALTKLDEQHATQLTELLEAIDKDHCGKLQSVIQKIDEDHCGKLKYLVNKYKTVINEDAKNFKSKLVSQISSYFDLYLDEAIPKQEIAEAVTNKQAQKTLHEIKQLVAVDEDYISETIREAVQDGKGQIEVLKSELNESIKQNIKLAQVNKSAKSALILEKTTRNYDKEKRDFVINTLKGKDPDYITENLSYVVKMFDRDETSARQLLAESGKRTAKSKTVDVPTSKLDKVDKQMITENNTGSTDEDTQVSDYLKSLEKQDQYKR